MMNFSATYDSFLLRSRGSTSKIRSSHQLGYTSIWATWKIHQTIFVIIEWSGCTLTPISCQYHVRSTSPWARAPGVIVQLILCLQSYEAPRASILLLHIATYRLSWLVVIGIGTFTIVEVIWNQVAFDGSLISHTVVEEALGITSAFLLVVMVITLVGKESELWSLKFIVIFIRFLEVSLFFNLILINSLLTIIISACGGHDWHLLHIISISELFLIHKVLARTN